MPTTIVYARPPARIRRQKAPQAVHSGPQPVRIVSARKPNTPSRIEPSVPYDLEARIEAAEQIWQKMKQAATKR